MTTATATGGARRQRTRGALIGGIFGCVFLLANAHTPLGSAAADLFRVLGVAGLVVLIIGSQRALKRPAVQPPHARDRIELFGRRWRAIVAWEIAALASGFAVIWLIAAPSETYLPWTVLVVGAHFIAFQLAGVWPGNIAAAAGLTLLGIAGLVLAAAAETDWIPFVSGVLPGLILLTGSLSAMRRAT